jgi:hypothetical protein
MRTRPDPYADLMSEQDNPAVDVDQIMARIREGIRARGGSDRMQRRTILDRAMATAVARLLFRLARRLLLDLRPPR